MILIGLRCYDLNGQHRYKKLLRCYNHLKMSRAANYQYQDFHWLEFKWMNDTIGYNVCVYKARFYIPSHRHTLHLMPRKVRMALRITIFVLVSILWTRPKELIKRTLKELKNRWRKKFSEKLGKCSPFTTSLSMSEGLSLKLKCFNFLLQMHAVKVLNESLKALDDWLISGQS